MKQTSAPRFKTSLRHTPSGGAATSFFMPTFSVVTAEERTHDAAIFGGQP